MDDRIKHICSIDDLILIVVTSKEKQVVGKRSTKLLQDSIIASAIFCSKPTYNYLILIGVSNQLHHGITYSENYGIGTFLLSTIDQIGKCMQSKFMPIYCQVTKHSKARDFYRKNFFYNVSKNNSVLKTIIQDQPNIVIQDKSNEMVWWRSQGPTYNITGAWVANYPDQHSVIKEIFDSGRNIFFGKDCTQKITKENRFINVSNILLNKYKWKSWDIDSKYVNEKL